MSSAEKKTIGVNSKDELGDYADAVHAGLKHAFHVTVKIPEEATQHLLTVAGGLIGEEWETSQEVHILLKRKTAPPSEAMKIVMCAKASGYEAWRNLAIRYQPPAGIRRMKELSELTQLQNKSCKNAAETSSMVLEIDRKGYANPGNKWLSTGR